jgi:hypothetical protein
LAKSNLNRWVFFFFYQVLSFDFSFRASKEEMLQRAGTNVNNRGPPVPDGPPVNAAGDKGFTFTQLPS